MFRILLEVYELIIIARVVISWMNVDKNQQWVKMLHSMTEPVLAPIRHFLQRFNLGAMDLSPLVIILAIQLIKMLL